MHIVFLSGEYPLWTTGGVGTFIQTLGRGLVQMGHEVSVVGPGNEKEEVQLEDKGVRLYRLPQNSTKLPNFWVNSKRINEKLKDLHRENPIAIIEAAEGGLAFISSDHTAKKVIRLHGGHHFFAEAEKRRINWRKGRLERRSFRKADGFIAVSNYVKEHTAKYLSYGGKPVSIINLPLNTHRDFPQVLPKENHILFAGTVCEKKGVQQLLKAFRLVREQYPNKILDIYGREWLYPNGTSYEAYLRETLEKDYFENVIFHGRIPRDQLDVAYARSEFCVFPSLMETQGLVSIEAMLLKKPVIFTQYGPGPETINHKETGLLCDVYDPSDIAEKMIWCIENPEQAAQMGERAYKQVKTHYELESIAVKNLDFYSDLTKNK